MYVYLIVCDDETFWFSNYSVSIKLGRIHNIMLCSNIVGRYCEDELKREFSTRRVFFYYFFVCLRLLLYSSSGCDLNKNKQNVLTLQFGGREILEEYIQFRRNVIATPPPCYYHNTSTTILLPVIGL